MTKAWVSFMENYLPKTTVKTYKKPVLIAVLILSLGALAAGAIIISQTFLKRDTVAPTESQASNEAYPEACATVTCSGSPGDSFYLTNVQKYGGPNKVSECISCAPDPLGCLQGGEDDANLGGCTIQEGQTSCSMTRCKTCGGVQIHADCGATAYAGLSAAECRECREEEPPEDVNVLLSGDTYCVIKNGGGERINIPNIPIMFIQDTNGDGNPDYTQIAVSDDYGRWSAVKKASEWLNPSGAIRPDGSPDFPYASATDEFTGVDNGITCQDSNVEGVSFNSDYTQIIEQAGCMRPNSPNNFPIYTNGGVDFNLGYCEEIPSFGEISCDSLTKLPANPEVGEALTFTCEGSGDGITSVTFKIDSPSASPEEYTCPGTYCTLFSNNRAVLNYPHPAEAGDYIACSKVCTADHCTDYDERCFYTGDQ